MSESVFEVFDIEFRRKLGVDGFSVGEICRFMKRNGIDPTVDEFKKLKQEDIEKIKGFGREKQNKVLWLVDYLNGKVDGKYEKHIALESNVIKELEKNIELKDEKINKLNQKINELQEENKKIRQENRELRKNDRIIEKLKEVLNCV